jgi:hypothetical protein
MAGLSGKMEIEGKTEGIRTVNKDPQFMQRHIFASLPELYCHNAH